MKRQATMGGQDTPTAHTPTTHTAQYGTASIPFTLTRKRRKTLGIRVTPAGAVEVSAPPELPLNEIVRLVAGRGRWITGKLREVSRLPAPLPKRQFVSGESWRYLGRQYRLRVLPVSRDKEGVRLWRGRIEVRACAPERVEGLLHAWLRARAEAVFARRMERCLEHAAAFGLRHSGAFTLRQMRTRWGSLSAGGRLTLNTLLIHAPTECIDYVILHELCHLREFNHSRAYYDLLGRVCPDWRKRRERLNAVELPQKN